MKKLFVLGVSFFLVGVGNLSAGKRVQRPAYSGVAYQSKSLNFDQSVSYENPRVVYRGEWRKVYGGSSATGLCVLFGYRKPTVATIEKRFNPTVGLDEWGDSISATETMVNISGSGQMAGASTTSYYADVVTCKQ